MTQHQPARTRFTRDHALAQVALRNADFERLKALMDEDVRRDDRRRRGALELFGAGLVAAGLFGTPLGATLYGALEGLWTARPAEATELARADRAALPERPSELSADVEAPSAEPARGGEAAAPEAAGTEGEGLPAGLARAVAVVFSDGLQVGRGRHYDVRLPEAARAALRSVGVPPPPRSASPAAREAALVRGLGRLVAQLDSVEAALACLRVDRGLVETALDLAFGSNLREPQKLVSFARYLPPSARRAAEGPTEHVMALAIGYDLHWPTPESARVSSAFGHRVHPVLGETMWHGGTDIAVDRGTPIRAMADGFVLYSKRDWVNGKFVKLDHGYGLTSAYVHNSRLLVRKGEKVRKGQIIALSGETGRATGPHLHFQVEIDDRPVDPEAFRERKAPRAHRRSIEAEAIGEARLPR